MKVIILSVFVYIVSCSCPNLCNHHGSCSSNGVCNCYPGWTEGDCSGTCPFGEPYADTQEHDEDRYIECSGQGNCDRTTGLCQCYDGFGGSACHRTLCENNCNNHGLCLPVTNLGINNDNYLSDYYYYTGKKANDAYTSWDKDQSYQCVCDEEYTGYDCGLKKCATGYKQTSDCDAPAEYYQKIAFNGAGNKICPTTDINTVSGINTMSGCLAYAKYMDQFNRTWITKPFNIFKNMSKEWGENSDKPDDNNKKGLFNYVNRMCKGLKADGEVSNLDTDKDAISGKYLSEYPSLYEALKMLPPGTIDLKAVKVEPPKESGKAFTITIEYGNQQTGRQNPIQILKRDELTFDCVKNLLEPIPSYFADSQKECYASTSECKDSDKCIEVSDEELAKETWKRNIDKGTPPTPTAGAADTNSPYITYLENVVFNNVDTVYVPPLECANNGLCNRQTGLCECFSGYYGLACTEASPIQ